MQASPTIPRTSFPAKCALTINTGVCISTFWRSLQRCWYAGWKPKAGLCSGVILFKKVRMRNFDSGGWVWDWPYHDFCYLSSAMCQFKVIRSDRRCYNYVYHLSGLPSIIIYGHGQCCFVPPSENQTLQRPVLQVTEQADTIPSHA